MGKPIRVSVIKSNIEVRKNLLEDGLEVYDLTMANGKNARFVKVDPETHAKLRSKAYTYVTP